MKWSSNVCIFKCIDQGFAVERSLFPIIGGIFTSTVGRSGLYPVPFSAIDVASAWFYIKNYKTTKDMIIPHHLYKIFEFFSSDKFTNWSRYAPFVRSSRNIVNIIEWLNEKNSEFDPKLEDAIRNVYLEYVRSNFDLAVLRLEYDDFCDDLLHTDICNTPTLKLDAIMTFYAKLEGESYQHEGGSTMYIPLQTFMQNFNILTYVLNPDFDSDIGARDDYEEICEFIDNTRFLQKAIIKEYGYLQGRLTNKQSIEERTARLAYSNLFSVSLSLGSKTLDLNVILPKKDVSKLDKYD